MGEGQLADLLADARAGGRVLDAPGARLVAGERVAQTAESIGENLAAYHEANPKRLGMSREDLAAAVDTARALFAVALEQMLADGRVERHDEVLGLPGRGANLSAEDLALCERIEDALRSAGLTPPLPADLAASLGADAARFDAMAAVLADWGKVARLDAKVLLHTEALAAAREVVLGLFRQANSFTTMEFRDALNVSRKYAVPILDYFDSARLTTRSGNRRMPGAAAKKLLGS